MKITQLFYLILLVALGSCSQPYNRELDGVWKSSTDGVPSFSIRADSIYYNDAPPPNQFKLAVDGDELSIDYNGYIFKAHYALMADTLHIEDSSSVSVFVRIAR